MNEERIERFIQGMRNPGTVKAFTEGYCYWLARILQERFGGELMYDPVEGHFTTKIEDSEWDITGKREPAGRIRWIEYKRIEPLDSEGVVKYCVNKISD